MAPSHLLDLPLDVFLLILEHTDIDTFLSLRQLNRLIDTLIRTHTASLIHGVAHTTFPGRPRMLSLSLAEPKPHGLTWLKRLRLKQVAAIIVEKTQHPQDSQLAGRHVPMFCAEDPGGDALRHTLFCGLLVLDHCSQFARSVMQTPLDQLPQAPPFELPLPKDRIWHAPGRGGTRWFIGGVPPDRVVAEYQSEGYQEPWPREMIVAHHIAKYLGICGGAQMDSAIGFFLLQSYLSIHRSRERYPTQPDAPWLPPYCTSHWWYHITMGCLLLWKHWSCPSATEIPAWDELEQVGRLMKLVVRKAALVAIRASANVPYKPSLRLAKQYHARDYSYLHSAYQESFGDVSFEF